MTMPFRAGRISPRILVILVMFMAASLTAQLRAQKIADRLYWVWLKDKAGSSYSVDQPLDFLSERSVQRRALQDLAVDARDLPVSGTYLSQLHDMDLEIVHISRWLNGFGLVGDQQDYDAVMALSFTDSIPWNPPAAELHHPWPGEQERFGSLPENPLSWDYGQAATQVEMTNTHLLHEIGYQGDGVWIAVLDGGFHKADSLPVFAALHQEGRILGTRNFVHEGCIYRENSSHGMKVLSTMAAHLNAEMVGTAPRASYLLCMTEDPLQETRMEELAWIAAAEYADSLGVDLINTSLGYSLFDGGGIYDYSYEDLDGEAALISRAASLLASRGIVGCISAGNSGRESWYYITPPADAKDVLTAGAVTDDQELASFSSRGPSYDARIKPDVANMGIAVTVQGTSGSLSRSNGTSFSSPLTCGSVASLWQAFPQLPARDLVQLVRNSSDRYDDPDIEFGFGIPDFWGAYHQITSRPQHAINGRLRIWPNPGDGCFRLALPWPDAGPHQLLVLDVQGRIVLHSTWTAGEQVHLPEELPSGVYIINLESRDRIFRARLIKH